MNEFVSITSHKDYLMAITKDGRLYKIVIDDLLTYDIKVYQLMKIQQHSIIEELK